MNNTNENDKSTEFYETLQNSQLESEAEELIERATKVSIAYLLESQAEGVDSNHEFQQDLSSRLDVAEKEEDRGCLGQSPKASIIKITGHVSN